MVFPVEPLLLPLTVTPFPLLPETTLRAAGVVPPTVLPVPESSATPSLLREAALPAGFVPTKLPSTTLLLPRTATPRPEKRLTARPRTRQPSALTLRPF